jgi:phosphoribosylpyrophosphate synthetase
MLKAAGADRLVILRLHSPKSATAWPLIEMKNVGTRKFLVQYLKHESGIDFSDCAIAAPDVGAAKDARNFAENLGNLPLSMIDKRRDTVHGATAEQRKS